MILRPNTDAFDDAANAYEKHLANFVQWRDYLHDEVTVRNLKVVVSETNASEFRVEFLGRTFAIVHSFLLNVEQAASSLTSYIVNGPEAVSRGYEEIAQVRIDNFGSVGLGPTSANLQKKNDAEPILFYLMCRPEPELR